MERREILTWITIAGALVIGVVGLVIGITAKSDSASSEEFEQLREALAAGGKQLNQELTAQGEEVTKGTARAESEAKAAGRKGQQAKNQVNQLSSEVSKLTDEVRSLTRQVSNLSGDYKAQQQQLDNLQSNLNQLQKQVDKLE